MIKNIVALFSCSILLTGAVAQQQPLQWQLVQPGIWKASIGKGTMTSFIALMQAVPQTAALQQLPAASFPLPQEDMLGQLSNGRVLLQFPLQKDEALFGLGLNFKTVNQRERILNLHMDHYGGSDNGRTHAPVPFYVSSKGYGILVDAAAYITVYAGSAVRKDAKHPPALKDRNTDKTWEAQPYSDAVEISIPGTNADIYLFAGPSTLNAVQRYNLFNGGGCLPPKWGLGFTQRVPTLYNQDSILREANAFEQHGFPLDFIGVEPGWQSMAYPCTLEWDSTRFPDPAAFNKLLRSKLASR